MKEDILFLVQKCRSCWLFRSAVLFFLFRSAVLFFFVQKCRIFSLVQKCRSCFLFRSAVLSLFSLQYNRKNYGSSEAKKIIRHFWTRHNYGTSEQKKSTALLNKKQLRQFWTKKMVSSLLKIIKLVTNLFAKEIWKQ